MLVVDPQSPDPAAIARAAAVLRSGRLVAFPTETVYGLGVHALDVAAVRRLFAAKGRPSTDPLIVHVESVDAVAPLVTTMPEGARVLAARFWPGPLTLVMPRSPRVPPEVTAGLDTVAIRMPNHPIARALLQASGVPIAAPSANLFSHTSPTLASHVLEDLDGRIDLILDGGATPVGLESTVLDLTSDPPAILRPGGISQEALSELLPGVAVRKAAAPLAGAGLPSPGMLERHYAPRAALALYEGPSADVFQRILQDARRARSEGRRVAIVGATEDRQWLDAAGTGIEVAELGSIGDLPTVASRLYATLRDLDRRDVDLILVRSFPADGGLGAAIHDRLRRAAAAGIVQVTAHSS